MFVFEIEQLIPEGDDRGPTVSCRPLVADPLDPRALARAASVKPVLAHLDRQLATRIRYKL